MKALVYAALGGAATTAAAVALGWSLLVRLRTPLARAERMVLGFAVGSALLSTLVLGLGVAGLAHKGVFWAVVVVSLVLAWGHRHTEDEALPPAPRRWIWLLGAAYILFGLVYLINAAAPECSPDGQTYHLGWVSRYYREHRISCITTDMYAMLSAGMEMLFLLAFSIGRHSAAALVHLTWLLALPWMILMWGRRFGVARPAAAAALMVFTSPVVGIDGASAYNDVALAGCLFAMFYFLQLLRQHPDRLRETLIPAGLLAGFAFAIKYTGFVAAIFLAGACLWILRKSWRVALKGVVLALGSCAVVALPWPAKNTICLGNPVAPFLNTLFPNPYIHPDFERDYRAYLRSYGGVALWEVPREAAIEGHRLGGLTGPVFLLAPAGLLALGGPSGRWIAAAALVFLAPYPANIGTRFLIPALPFLALLIALTFARAPGVLALLTLFHLWTAWPFNIPRYAHEHTWRIISVPWRAALRVAPEDQFLAERSPDYVRARLVEQHTPPGAKIFTLGYGIALAYTTREIIAGSTSAFGRNLRDVLDSAIFDGIKPARPLEFRFPPQRARRLRVVQTAQPKTDLWSVAEFRIFYQGQEAKREPEWRVRAWPRPWDAERAFDGSLVTRWNTRQTATPGMFLEVDMGKSRLVDQVRLETCPDHWYVRLQLEGAEEGSWRVLSRDPRPAQPIDLRGLGRAALREFHRADIHYFLLSKDEFAADTYYAHLIGWGAHLVEERGGAWLFDLD